MFRREESVDPPLGEQDLEGKLDCFLSFWKLPYNVLSFKGRGKGPRGEPCGRGRWEQRGVDGKGPGVLRNHCILQSQ